MKSSAEKLVDEFRVWLNDDFVQNSEVMWEVLANDYIVPFIRRKEASDRNRVLDEAKEAVEAEFTGVVKIYQPNSMKRMLLKRIDSLRAGE